MATARGPAVEVADLHAWYGESHILHGMGFEVREGEVVTLLGRNGAGKTTTLRSIMGMVQRRQGQVRLGGAELIGLPSNRIARLGHRAVPRGARHLRQPQRAREPDAAAARCGRAGCRVERIFELFPNLKERLGSQGTKLSGGEQQMLAIARILRTGARVLLLDEPTEGLAPVIVQQIGRTIRELKRAGLHDPAGRAELPLRRDRRRPALRGRARPGRRHGPERRDRAAGGQAARVSGRMIKRNGS